MSQTPPNPGNSQRHARNQRRIQTLAQALTRTLTANSVQDQPEAQNEYLNAQTAVRLNEFLAKTRRLVASELGNDMNCTICSEAFLRGKNPEVPVRLDCGHIFGMNCILKWLSPVSRNGNNSCPNCRKPVFDDWYRMDFPAERQGAPARRVVAAAAAAAVRAPAAVDRNVVRAPAASSHVNTESTRATPAMAGTADAPRDGRPGPPYSPRARPLPAAFPRPLRARRTAPTPVAAEPIDATATATTSSATATPDTVAPNTPLPSPAVAAQEVQGQQQAVQQPQPAVMNESRIFDRTNSSLVHWEGPWPAWLGPFPVWMERRAQRAASTISQMESEDSTARSQRFEEIRIRLAEARSNAASGRQLAHEAREAETETHVYTQGATSRPAVATTPARAEAARPAEDEESIDGVAAMFTAAEDEHHRRRQQAATQAATQERRRYMWIQFCEGVVRAIEASDDSTAFTTHGLALTIITMENLDEFIAERAAESPTWRRILQTFPRLHTEMVTRFDDFRPLPSVKIDNRMELERLLAPAGFDREMLHKARWHTRLSERVARAAAASNHDAAVARLAERVANLGGPSRETAASTTGAGAEPTSEETREMRRMEDYLLGRTPITIRREAAASVDAALRAGAGSSFAMARVRRL